MTEPEKAKWLIFIQRGLRQNNPPHPRHAVPPAPNGLSMEEYERLYQEAVKDYPLSVFMTVEQDAKYRAGLKWWE